VYKRQSLYLPVVGTPIAHEFARFDEVMQTLRDGCPWYAEQTHASLRPYLVEETYEVIEALDARAAHDDGDLVEELDDHLLEELGDLLYQIFFHARLAAGRGAFTISDVAREIHDKMVSRNPHVFGDVTVDSAENVEANWEALKAKEKQRESALDGIPLALPALALAMKFQSRAAKAGFDWDGGVEVAFADVEAELAELRDEPSEHELGDLLFAGVQVARRLNVDPEVALRSAVKRYGARFRQVEKLAGSAQALADADESQLNAWWTEAKQAESASR